MVTMTRYLKTFIATLLALFALTGAAGAMAAVTAHHQTLALESGSGKVRLVMELSGKPRYKYFSLSRPDRFVVDLFDVIRTGKGPKLDYAGTPIERIRLGIRKGDDLRMVVDLDQSVEARAFIEPAGRGRHRLVVELSGFRKAAQPVAKKAQAPARKVAKAESRPAASPKPVKSASQAMGPYRDIVIAIDAGHGGGDPGAKGHNGTYEKHVTLAIARRLARLVEKEPGMRPVLIRDGDYYVTLRQRVEKAQLHNADLFISIHADAFDDPRVRGASVYTLSRRGATTEAARLLADRENSADIIGFLADVQDEPLASVLIDLSQNAMIEASMDVASRVLQQMGRVNLLHKRRVEQAGFVVLKSPDIPSILIETAFISNPKDERNLLSRNHQQKLAEAIMRGIRSYFIDNPPPGARLAAREHVIQRGDTLTAIAERYDVSLKELRQLNKLKGDRLYVGRVLQIPQTGS